MKNQESRTKYKNLHASHPLLTDLRFDLSSYGELLQRVAQRQRFVILRLPLFWLFALLCRVNQVTQVLGRIGHGDPHAAEQLLPLVYEELRKLAAARMANESGTQTLQATALVHEAWLRLVSEGDRTWQNRAQFFAAAAEAMRRILIDRARRKHTLKRGAGAERIDLDRLDVALEADAATLLRVNEALEKFVVQDPQAAQLVKLRFFVGMDYTEAAQTLGISERTAKRCWSFARAWLFRELSRQAAE